MVVTKLQKSKSLVFLGFYYTTLDFIEPSCKSKNKQAGELALPPVWDIAPNSDVVAANVISKNPWGCDCLIVSDGSAIHTSVGARPGEVSRTGSLANVDGFKFMPQSVSEGRILIRHPVVWLADSESVALKAWDTRIFTDCIVSCAGEDISCHRMILASRSPVFEKMLNSSIREGSANRIDIGEAEPRNVRAMLKAMYIGHIDEDVDLAEVMMLADRYECLSLAIACAEGLVDAVDTDNISAGVQRLRSLREKPPFDDLFEQMVAKVKQNSDLVRVMMLSV